MHVFGIAIQDSPGFQTLRKHIVEHSLPDLGNGGEVASCDMHDISCACQPPVSCRCRLLEGCGIGEYAWQNMHFTGELLIGASETSQRKILTHESR